MKCNDFAKQKAIAPAILLCKDVDISGSSEADETQASCILPQAEEIFFLFSSINYLYAQ